jgi:hypothetical protein
MTNSKIDFVAVGPQRTGSTWLFSALSCSPAICFPKNVKETMFFDQYFDKGMDWYYSHFLHRKDGQVIGEVGPTYFNCPEAPSRIATHSSTCKIFINLRHPVKRVYSLYLHYLAIGRVQGSFQSAIAQSEHILDAGKYSIHIPSWQKYFSQENLFLILMDRIKHEPNFLLNEICDFLGVEKISTPKTAYEKVNAATLPKYPWMAKVLTDMSVTLRKKRLHSIVEFGKSLGLRRVYSGSTQVFPVLTNEDILFLCDFYKDDVQFVEDYLGQSLESWKIYDYPQ